MKHDELNAHPENKQNHDDIAEVVVGASSRLNKTQLTQDNLVKTLLQLLTRSQEITASIIKESTRGYVHDYDCTPQQQICRVYTNTSLAMSQIRILRTLSNEATEHVLETYLSVCLSGLYMSLSEIGKFLHHKTLAANVDLMYWHAGQVLALTVNAIDFIQTHAFRAGLYRKKNKNRVPSLLAAKTTRVLEVVNRSVNRLRPQTDTNICSAAVIFRATAELNILHRLVIHTESFELWTHEEDIVRDLIVKRLWALQAQLLQIASSDKEMGEGNVLLCQVAFSTLTYYEMVMHSALDFSSPIQPVQNNSLAFSLIESLSLALETSICHGVQNPSAEDKSTHLGILRKIFGLCNEIYAAMNAYYKQLLLLETLYLATGHADYNACLCCIESALQKVKVIKSKVAAPSDPINQYLQMLEESLTESDKLCSSALQDTSASSQSCEPSSALDDITVLACFYDANKGTHPISLDSIDEEMWLQGIGWGGEYGGILCYMGERYRG